MKVSYIYRLEPQRKSKNVSVLVKIFILTFILFLTTLISCREVTIRPDGGCRPATLYYAPDCGSVKAYVVLDEDGSTKTILQEIPREFRSNGTRICINFREVSPSSTDGCVRGSVIEIVSIGTL